MKKILALILVAFMAIACVACGGDEGGESSTVFQASSEAETESSATADESSEAADEESSEAATESSEVVDESTGETSEGEGETSEGEGETSEEETVTVTYTNKYVSWKIATGNGGRTDIRATDATSLQLSKINADLEEGDTGVFTYTYGKKVEISADYAVVVAEYDHESFSYVRKEFLEAGDGEVSIPKDGFVIAIWKDNTDKINAISTTTNPLFPHGFAANTGLDAKIDAAKTAPTIDGKVDKKEYGDVIWDVTPDNELMSYAQFEKNNYFATAKVYMTYDEEHLYLAVVVDTPYHYCPVNESTKGNLWKYSAIQVNLGSNARTSDVINEHWDWAIDTTTTAANEMRQYGFCLSDEGTEHTLVWQGDSSILADNFRVTREGDITTYEVAFNWSDLKLGGETYAPKKGDELQVGVSFNLGLSEAEQFKNITLRDGGGIIGINDWSKIPNITLD